MMTVDAVNSEMNINIDAIIKSARIGRERRDAQVDTCSVFAAALYDVLSTHGIPCLMVTAIASGPLNWAHAVVEVSGRYYDSMGEFSASIYRLRAKIHPKVDLNVVYWPDSRIDCFELEYVELHAFFIKELTKSFRASAASIAA